MPNVWDAMKKHQAEEKAKAAQVKEQAPAAPVAAEQSHKPGRAIPATVPAPGGGLPAIGEDGYKYSAVLVPHHDRGGPIAEQYRALRTNLLARAANEKFCMLVTSSEPGEGKTVTCLNLAMVLAERQEFQTIVVDCDLRRSMIATLLAEEHSPGLADLLAETAVLADVVRQTIYPNVSYIAAGDIPAEKVGEMIARPRMEEVLAEVRRKYDYVILDTPPVNTVADTGILGRSVEDALLVVRMNKTSRDAVDRAIRLLHAAEIRIGGMVLTHQKYFIPTYLYRYS